jgi:hypothetical protein
MFGVRFVPIYPGIFADSLSQVSKINVNFSVSYSKDVEGL